MRSVPPWFLGSATEKLKCSSLPPVPKSFALSGTWKFRGRRRESVPIRVAPANNTTPNATANSDGVASKSVEVKDNGGGDEEEQ